MPTHPRWRVAVSLLSILLLCVLLPVRAPAQDADVLDEIVAVVDGSIILRSDVDGYVMGLTQQQGMSYSDELWMEALNQLIDQHVLTAHAERDTTIKVTEEQVDQALDQRVRQLVSQVGSEQRLEQIYGESLVQIKADLRRDFRQRLLAEQFRNRKMSTVRITPSEVERWFEQFPTDSLPTLPTTVRLAHIVRYPKASEQARREAQEVISAIRDSIVTGTATIEEMARRFSDDTGSAADGGRITDIELGALVPEFAAVASRIPIDEISQPFETTFGYHVLRVNERRGDVVDFNHILIRVDESRADPTEAIAYLDAVRDSILTQSIPFAVMARRHSEEETSAEMGGRVLDPQTGERTLYLNALGPSWQSTLDTMEVGEVSKPAEAELLDGSRAYHIVELQKYQAEHRVGLEQDYQFIKERALQDKRARIMRAWLDRLRQDVFIDLRGKAEALSSSLAQGPSAAQR